jgi:hypothetical protein
MTEGSEKREEGGGRGSYSEGRKGKGEEGNKPFECTLMAVLLPFPNKTVTSNCR